MGVGSFRTGFDDVAARLESGPDGLRLTGRARVDSITIRRPPEFRARVVDGEEFSTSASTPRSASGRDTSSSPTTARRRSTGC
jgi:hypothetical protein